MALNVLQGVYPESSIGRGVETGLKGLMNQLGQQQQTNQLTQMFQKGGYPANIAQILGKLGSTNPEILPKILENLQMPSPQGQMGQQQGMMQEDMEGQQQQEPTFAQSYSPKKGENPQQEKIRKDILDRRTSLLNLRELYESLGEQVDNPSLQYGVLAHKLSKDAPSWLNEATEFFDKGSADVINKESETIKGLPTKLRLGFMEKAKPGVMHRPQVNKRIIADKIKGIDNILEALEKEYPKFLKTTGRSQNKMPQELELTEKDVIKRNGKLYYKDPESGQLLEIQEI